MNGIVLKITIIALSLPIIGCSSLSLKGQENLTPVQATEARRAIAAYLECEECDSGELEALVKLGQNISPSLAATLRDGPSPATRELYRRQLLATYKGLKEYEANHPEAKVPMEEQKYVMTYLDNQAAYHRIRAATALAAIGGEGARKALEQAQEAAYRDDVKLAVKAALDKLKKR
jgi:hypothetical protein